jgi:hypothetical protein
MIGAIFGQKLAMYAHDPAVLEENTLNFVQESYIAGCTGSEDGKDAPQDQKAYDRCVTGSQKYRVDIASIFHNKIWDRPAKGSHEK